MSKKLIISGAREHNLQDVSLEIPRDKLVVFTGISGSGKSSLAFDTIYAEGQRRYVESLSAYARQFLGQLTKPDVDLIEGLSPAVAIDQKTTSRNPRSTVGTITEIYDYLRLLFARIGILHDPETGERLVKQTPQQIVDRVLQLPDKTRFSVLAPIVRGRKGTYDTLLENLAKQGFTRVLIDGEQTKLEDFINANNSSNADNSDDARSAPSGPSLARYEMHDISLIVDRLVIKKVDDKNTEKNIEKRLTDSIETALAMAEGIAQIELHSDSEESEILTFSESLSRPSDGKSFAEISPRNFSFNSPYGACAKCDGIGTTFEVAPELVVPNESISIEDGAIVPWSTGYSRYYTRLLKAVGESENIDITKPWSKLSKAHKKLLLEDGLDHTVSVKYRNRHGRSRTYNVKFEGVIPHLKRRHSDASSDRARQYYESHMRETDCGVCNGARLNPMSLAVTVDGKSIYDFCSLSIQEATELIENVKLTERERHIADQVLKEIKARLGFLLAVGLSYLTLGRSSATLSGGEAQRIRLASQVGSGLVGVLYALDEPSIGLHQRDNARLLKTLTDLRDLGNTLIVVEHDEETIRQADYIVDIGPGAGIHGGEIVHAGTLKSLEANTNSITADYLSGRKKVKIPELRRNPRKEWLKVTSASENNLKDIDVDFPLGCFVAVTGVSGSGKSTLVNEILYKSLMVNIYKSKLVPGRHKSIEGIEHLDKVCNINQQPIGRTPRSNPATYTKMFDHIRNLFAATNESKIRGYKPGRFSFNVKGGRCEACSGDGTLKIEMHFLADVYVTCELCLGSRYNRDTLEITFKGHTVADVLGMSCGEALKVFEKQPKIARHLQTLVDVGLDYIKLGQPAPTLSGGEAQRVKLASELAKRSTGHTIYILDEPTTGLHFEDVRKLLEVLDRLVELGNTVIVIEHNLDVIKVVDWVIDLGPEGGDKGGEVIAIGAPEIIAENKKSFTGEYLAPLFVT